MSTLCVEGNAAGNVDGLEELGGCVPSSVSELQGVGVSCVHIVVGRVCWKARPGECREKCVPGRCLGFRFFLLPHYLFLVIATSEMFTPKLSHN